MSIADVLERKERPAYVRFERRPIEDKVESRTQGHYVAKDVDFALITPPYSKDVMIFKVPQWMEQLENDLRNERLPKSWVDQYKEAYQSWKRGEEPPLHGTPIKGWGVISPAQQETLVRMHILTVEDLAKVNDEGIKRIGMGGVDCKLKAQAWISQLQDKGPLTQEIAAVTAENRVLKASQETLTRQVEELTRLVKAQQQPQPQPAQTPAPEISASDLIEEEDPVVAYTKKFGKPPHHRMKAESIVAALKD